MADYLPILTLLVLATVFSALSFLASQLLAPRRPTAAKSAPYECGIIPDREPVERFPVRFYLVAMIFIIFDIEIIFLYPWAVVADRLGAYGLAEILLFAAAVFVSFVYLIANGALDWGPVKQLRRLEVRLGERTTTSTVRRISRDGSDSAGRGRTGEAA